MDEKIPLPPGAEAPDDDARTDGALRRRAEELDRRERLLKVKERLIQLRLPEEAAELVNTDSDESADAALRTLQKLLRAAAPGAPDLTAPERAPEDGYREKARRWLREHAWRFDMNEQ